MRVRAGARYIYNPVGMDRFDPASTATAGETVRVVKCHGCPPPNTMGHAHIESVDGRTFYGLVMTSSLTPVVKKVKV